MRFIKQYTVRWHDTDTNRMMTPSHLLMYMEDASDAHLRSAGMSMDELRDRRGLAFIISRIAARSYLPLYAGDVIDVETWVCEGRGLSFIRCYRVLRGGEVAAEAYSVWALLELATRRLLPVADFPYDIEPELPLGPEVSARVRLPAADSMEAVGTRRVVYSDIDYNGHMNNTHYPNMLCDFTPDIRSLRVSGFMLSFLHEAAYGMTVQILRCSRADGYSFRTLDSEGNTCLEAVLLTEPLTTPDCTKEG